MSLGPIDPTHASNLANQAQMKQRANQVEGLVKGLLSDVSNIEEIFIFLYSDIPVVKVNLKEGSTDQDINNIKELLISNGAKNSKNGDLIMNGVEISVGIPCGYIEC